MLWNTKHNFHFKEVNYQMTNTGKPRTAAEIQKDWDENPRWANVTRD